MKNFQYRLENSDHCIEVKLVYVLRTTEEINHEFLVTEDVLTELNLKASKFVAYLKNDLERSDPSYDAAASLWSSNRCFDKKRYATSSPTTRNQITKIISVKGTEYIEPIQKKTILTKK